MFHFDKFIFEPKTGHLTSQETTTAPQLLRNKVANLLTFFLEHPNQLIPKETLLSALWEYGDFRESALTQSIRELRIALNDDAKKPRFIKTIPQRGYQWICPIENSEKQPEIDQERSSDSQRLEKQQETQAPKKLNIFIVLAASFLLFLVTVGAWHLLSTAPLSASYSEAQSRQRVMVMPFINDTKNPTLDWIELGLADMLAIDLKRSQSVEVISPSQTSMALLQHQLPWPALPVQIRTLLSEYRAQTAIFASVRHHNNLQVIDFQVIHENGKIQQGSLSYPDLAPQIENIAQHILKLIDNSKTTIEAPQPDLSAMAIAQGMQALQTSGANNALRFFIAANTIQPTPWAKAYQGQSHIALGKWQQAKEDFSDITANELKKDSYLQAFVHFWQANLALKQGDATTQTWIDRSVQSSLASQDVNIIAQSYRLKATFAWQKMQWTQHQQMLEKALKYSYEHSELVTRADELFYLGQATNIGLEKSPFNDLVINKQRLTQALSYYQQLGNAEKIAATHLAIAQNYHFPQTQRQTALTKALTDFKTLNLPYELAQAKLYAGFYHMQLHQGHIAEQFFLEAKNIFTELGAKKALIWARFYLAFAYLDQGLDQSAQGRHGMNKKQLIKAITNLHTVIEDTNNPMLLASSYVFLGWAYSDLNQLTRAEQVLQKALTLSNDPMLTMTNEYARYSLMHVYLKQNKPEKVIALEKAPWSTRLQAVYLAKAYAESENFEQATMTLKKLQQSLPEMFTSRDQQQLQDYAKAATSGELNRLFDLPKAHSVYCESETLNLAN